MIQIIIKDKPQDGLIVPSWIVTIQEAEDKVTTMSFVYNTDTKDIVKRDAIRHALTYVLDNCDELPDIDVINFV